MTISISTVITSIDALHEYLTSIGELVQVQAGRDKDIGYGEQRVIEGFFQLPK